MIKQTKTGLKFLVFALIVSMMITSLVGCSNEGKDFSALGMSINLPEEFRRDDMEQFDIVYRSDDVVILITKTEITQDNEGYTLDGYTTSLALSCSLLPTDVKHTDGLTHFTYDAISKQNNVEYRYATYIYRSSDAFWGFQFVVATDIADTYTDLIHDWAKSVEFEAYEYKKKQAPDWVLVLFGCGGRIYEPWFAL